LLVTQSQELLSEPVRCGATMFIDNRFVHSKRLPLTAKILSFELRSLTATIRVKRPLIAHFSGVDLEKPIYLILKDGTRIEVTYHQSIYREGYDEVLCLFDRPVSREDVAFIELPGTGRFSAAGEEIR